MIIISRIDYMTYNRLSWMLSLPSRSTVLLYKGLWRGRGPDDEDDYGSRKSLRSASPTPLEADRPLNKI